MSFWQQKTQAQKDEFCFNNVYGHSEFKVLQELGADGEVVTTGLEKEFKEALIHTWID
jgi:hypothetical protein